MDSTQIENLKQSLLEHMADWLDRESTVFEMTFEGIKENEDCHIAMADAAFSAFLGNTSKEETDSEYRERRMKEEGITEQDIADTQYG